MTSLEPANDVSFESVCSGSVWPKLRALQELPPRELCDTQRRTRTDGVGDLPKFASTGMPR